MLGRKLVHSKTALLFFFFLSEHTGILLNAGKSVGSELQCNISQSKSMCRKRCLHIILFLTSIQFLFFTLLLDTISINWRGMFMIRDAEHDKKTKKILFIDLPFRHS